MGQYSAKNGVATAWHLQHYGSFATHGASLIFIEATAVSPEGRTSPEDLGIWNDKQAKELKKIVDFIHSQGQYVGIQLTHGGRKASSVAPFVSFQGTAVEKADGWPNDVVAPSAIKYGDGYLTPKELSLKGIEKIKKDFSSAAKRAIDIGFDVIEIHGAHGALLTQFLSPVSNKRTDRYGGSFENRIRLFFELIDGIRDVIPNTTPMFVRLSTTEGLEHDKNKYPESWELEDTKKVAFKLIEQGKIDLIDVSALGNNPDQKLPTYGKEPAYQAPYSYAIKEVVGDKILVSVVGGISDANVAESLLQRGLDLVFVGRFFLKSPGLVWSWADQLGIRLYQVKQYSLPFYGRTKRV